jgi:hypothetical protein
MVIANDIDRPTTRERRGCKGNHEEHESASGEAAKRHLPVQGTTETQKDTESPRPLLCLLYFSLAPNDGGRFRGGSKEKRLSRLSCLSWFRWAVGL